MPRLEINNELGEYSHYAREVLGAISPWILRWGTTVICAAIALLVGVAWWIKYPEVVPARIVVTTPMPPARLVAPSAGKLQRVTVRDQQQVAAGDMLAVIENTADTEAAQALAAQLNDSAAARACRINAARAAQPLPRLGVLQEAYAAYQARCGEYLESLRHDRAAQQLQALEARRRETLALLEVLTHQARTLKEKRALLEKDLARYASLRQAGTVSEKMLDDKRAERLDLRRAEEQLESERAAARIDLSRAEEERLQLRVLDERRVEEMRAQIDEAYQTLLGRIAEWERAYVLRAPIAGRVALFDYWSDNQYVAAGDEVMSIVPADAGEILGKMRVPLSNSGKLRVGQQVHIRLEGFPYQEYGLVQGRISNISQVPRQQTYAVEVALPAPLVTSFGKRLAFMQEMEGQADIVTQEARLLTRIFRELVAPFSRSLPGDDPPPAAVAPVELVLKESLIY